VLLLLVVGGEKSGTGARDGGDIGTVGCGSGDNGHAAAAAAAGAATVSVAEGAATKPEMLTLLALALTALRTGTGGGGAVNPVKAPPLLAEAALMLFAATKPLLA